MIYLFISLTIDLILSAATNLSYQDITYFFPLILVSSLPISYLLTKRKYLFLIFITLIGVLYDLIFSEIVLLNLYYFLLIGFIIHMFYQTKKQTPFNLIILSILCFIFYDIYLSITLILIEYQTFNINDLIYKITHSLIPNILYIVLSTIVLKSRIFGSEK